MSDRTRIVPSPPGVVVASSTDDVTVQCDAATDRRRSEHLMIMWYRNELPVSEQPDARLKVTQLQLSSCSIVYKLTDCKKKLLKRPRFFQWYML